MTKHSEHLLTIEITVALLSKYSLFKSLKGLGVEVWLNPMHIHEKLENKYWCNEKG